MKFKGDIIITDPCYIIKESNNKNSFPDRKDYFRYDSIKKYPDSKMSEKFSEDLIEILGEQVADLFITSKMYEEDEKKYYDAIETYNINNKDD